MQREIVLAMEKMKRIFQSTPSHRNFHLRPRCFSQLAHSHTQSVLKENDDFLVPKMPRFDYTPPPYTGPSTAEISKKRKEYLSPSIFHLFKNPVSSILSSFYLS
jgi:alanine-glyoxylate transaminase/(R)-3-amino-2-methylpropionate-pyruvate transaminase